MRRSWFSTCNWKILLFTIGQTLVLSIVIVVLGYDGMHGGHVPCGVTAHGSPGGPLQFDRLEAALAARLHRNAVSRPFARRGECRLDMSAAARSEGRAKLMGTRPAEPPPVLQQLNLAIKQLTARISPAVVQILVTGYGALEENNRGQTALITLEHAIGSGVILDPGGYIITNAHVVEGAQRTRADYR